MNYSKITLSTACILLVGALVGIGASCQAVGENGGDVLECNPDWLSNPIGSEQTCEVYTKAATIADEDIQQLINQFPDAPEVLGEIIYLYGKVIDQSGNPLSQYTVEIWQTDENGAYDHPGDSKTDSRNRNFQFFGSATTNKMGAYIFRTVIPHEYSSRPKHIHYKVKNNTQTVLTSQFYFKGEIETVKNDPLFGSVKEHQELLLISREVNSTYSDYVHAKGIIVIRSSNKPAELPATPSQAEGPYYPIPNVSEYDNDLLIVEQ